MGGGRSGGGRILNDEWEVCEILEPCESRQSRELRYADSARHEGATLGGDTRADMSLLSPLHRGVDAGMVGADFLAKM